MAENRCVDLTDVISTNFGRNRNNDVKFTVEKQELYTSAAILGISSPVFSEMFENDRKTFDLPGVKLEHFVEFLKCIYPNILQEITEETVYWLLPLAHKYQVKILQGKCFKLILQIVKKQYPKQAEELYHHIKLSEKLTEQPSQPPEQLELEKVCIEMASECTIDDLEKANGKYPISEATNVKIIKLALRRHEIAKQDEDFRSNRLRNIDRGTFQGVINNLLTQGKESQNEQDGQKEAAKFFMQALRLIYRYEKRNEYLKKEALGKFKSLGNLEDGDKEVYNLLPEEIKRDLENYKQDADAENQFYG